MNKVYRIDALKQFEFPLLSAKIPEGVLVLVTRDYVAIDNKITQDKLVIDRYEKVQNYIKKSKDPIIAIHLADDGEQMIAFYVNYNEKEILYGRLYYIYEDLRKLKEATDIQVNHSLRYLANYEQLQQIEHEIRSEGTAQRYLFLDPTYEEILFSLEILYYAKVLLRSWEKTGGIKSVRKLYVQLIERDNHSERNICKGKIYCIDTKKENRKIKPEVYESIKPGDYVAVQGRVKKLKYSEAAIPEKVKFVSYL
jgi:hypothetical protein